MSEHDRMSSGSRDALRQELDRTASERDELMYLVLRSNSTALSRLGRRWALFTAGRRWADRLIRRPARLAWLVITLRYPPGRRVSPLFDEAWYRKQYPDAPGGSRAAYRQYLSLSLSEGRDPSPYFDTDWYLAQNPDVAGGRWHPLDHYLYFGWREGRDPSRDFNGYEYLRHHPDAIDAATNPLLHMMRRGGLAPGDPADPFDPSGPRLPGPPPTIQRTLTHYRRHGVRRTIARAAAELGIVRRSMQRYGARPSIDVSERQPRRILAHLDTPRDGASEASSALLVSGWAFSNRSSEPVSVSIYLDAVLVTDADTGQHRPDVGAMYRRWPGAAEGGFSARVELSGVDPGEHWVHVVARDELGAVRIISRAFQRMEPETLYHHYYERTQPSAEELTLTKVATRADGVPEIQIGILVDDPDDAESTLRSLDEQDYQRLDYELLRGGRFGALEGPPDEQRLIGFMRAGERLMPGALWRFARASQEGAGLLYSDHDSVDDNGRHTDPWFVADWAPDHLLSQDYVGGLFLARDGELLRQALGEVEMGSEDWRYALLLRLAAARSTARHIPHVLWSRPAWRTPSDGAAAREEDIVRTELRRRNSEASVTTTHLCTRTSIRQIDWPLEKPPLVSVIIPTTARLEFVTAAIDSLAKTDYQPIEVIFIDNSHGRHPEGVAFLERQDVIVIERDEPFNWAKLNNDGARRATGELLLFINDDVEALDPGWLTTMVRQANRPDIGAVGSLLRYPDGTIQHAGVFLVGHGGGAVHLFRGLNPDDHLYLDWHRVAREVTAVTGACMLVRREVFDDVGGFDEGLAIIGNDVDLCMRIARTGRRVLMEPAASLVHHESRSRAGVDHYPDEGRMWERWSDALEAGDPHYNPNLSQVRVDAAPAWERVADIPAPIGGRDGSVGVNLVGYIRAEMGVGQAIRADAAALDAADVPFVILDHQGGSGARMGDASWVHKIVDEPVFDTNILHINADLLPRALGTLPPGLTKGRRNIGFWTWELPEFPAEWRGSFSLVDEVWVPSTFVRDAIGADAPVPIHVVPHAVRAPRGPFLGRDHFGLPADACQFLAMYDTQSVIERKNPQGAIEAFVRAFGPGDDAVSLVLKVNSGGDREVAQLRRLIAEHPNIHLVTETLSRHAVDSLMASSDVFVSLHRAEGFALPIAEAMALGKSVIATGWSGNMDFMDRESAVPVPYELTELSRSYGPYSAGQRWAEPDVAEAADAMRKLAADSALRDAVGARAAATIKQTLAPSVIGEIMRGLLGGHSPNV